MDLHMFRGTVIDGKYVDASSSNGVCIRHVHQVDSLLPCEEDVVRG